MSRLKESYLSEIHKINTDDNQSKIQSFSKSSDSSNEFGTKIAVVTDPTGGIVEACDEFIPELGMPESELNNFRRVRSNLSVSDDIKRHNKAVEITNLEEKYKKYIRNNKKAQDKLEQIAERIDSGEKITLVCFEKKPKWCHRHVLMDELKSMNLNRNGQTKGKN